MLRTLAAARVGGAGTRRPLPGSSRGAGVLLTSRQSSRAAAEEAAARAARVPNRKPLAGPRKMPAKRVGLYDPALEKDSCGVGLAVQMKSVASRQVCIHALVLRFFLRVLKCASVFIIPMTERGGIDVCACVYFVLVKSGTSVFVYG